MEYPLLPKQMPERIKNVWRKSALISSGILLLIVLVIGGILYWFDRLYGGLLWIVLGIGVVVLISLIVELCLIPYRYYFHRYEITSEDLAFQEGYFFRSITYVPINRIQHIETEQGPFLRQENLIELVIHTAATSHHILGLDVDEALELRNQIIELVRVAKEDV